MKLLHRPPVRLPQGRLDHVDQRLLARPSPGLLPLLPHHPAVHRRRVGHGGVRALTTGRQRPERIWLGPLVPEDAGVWLHVHGLRATEGRRHHQLLDVHLLCRARHRPVLHRAGPGAEGRQEGREGQGHGGEQGESCRQNWVSGCWRVNVKGWGDVGQRWECLCSMNAPFIPRVSTWLWEHVFYTSACLPVWWCALLASNTDEDFTKQRCWSKWDWCEQ